ncbi:MAG: protein-disulfide reductase DsbD domain-containing protein [Verrucomicrobiota bacterium]
MILRRLLLSAVWLACSFQAFGQTYGGRELVKAELVADTNAIVPGKPFTAGLLLHLVPGWHTYWKFPGDAGLPSEIKWKLPPGWKVSEIEWPIPLKLKDPGDIQTYGYSDEVLLMQQITPPSSVSDSTVKLSATATWLVCEKICIPGNAKLELALPIAITNAPANVETFTRFRGLLPQAYPTSPVVKQWSFKGSEVSITLSNAGFLAKYPFVDFYPLPDENSVVGHPTIHSRNGEDVTFKIPFETAPPNRIRGLIVAGESATDEHRTGWLFSGEMHAASPGASAPSRGVLTFLLFGFIGGFILNLMPCVLPVISLKIFGFIRHAGDSRNKILRSGLAFVAGIFAWFIGLALILIALKSAGREITWALQFTNPYFVLAMCAVVFVFALNLFGVFEISLPQSANKGVLNWTDRDDDAGAFFQGVFATVLATPCTAPYLGTALGFAFTQSNTMIFLMFLAIAAGMGAPYLLLAAQPAWLRFLPKPGPWMVKIKEFMGFLLFATLLFLLSVLGAQRGAEAVVWASAFLLVLGIACWMKGSFIVPAASFATRFVVLVLMLVIVIASGFYFIGDKFRSSNTRSSAQLSGDWNAFTPDRLKTELDQGHAVFIDFTAAWCITCKFNEATVLETRAARDAFRDHGIVKLKADWTNADPEITKLLKQFGRPGVPLYVLYPRGKFEDPFVFPELLTKSILLEKLETMGGNVSVK